MPKCNQSHRFGWMVPTDQHGNKTGFEKEVSRVYTGVVEKLVIFRPRTARQRMTLPNPKNCPLSLSLSHALVQLKSRCTAPLINTPIGHIFTGYKTGFSHRVKLSELICDLNLSKSYLPASLGGKMFRSYLKHWKISFSFRIYYLEY